jgi:hypothetical protein
MIVVTVRMECSFRPFLPASARSEFPMDFGPQRGNEEDLIFPLMMSNQQVQCVGVKPFIDQFARAFREA